MKSRGDLWNSNSTIIPGHAHPLLLPAWQDVPPVPNNVPPELKSILWKTHFSSLRLHIVLPSLSPHDMSQMHNFKYFLQEVVGQASVAHVRGRIRVYHLRDGTHTFTFSNEMRETNLTWSLRLPTDMYGRWKTEWCTGWGISSETWVWLILIWANLIQCYIAA